MTSSRLALIAAKNGDSLDQWSVGLHLQMTSLVRYLQICELPYQNVIKMQLPEKSYHYHYPTLPSNTFYDSSQTQY